MEAVATIIIIYIVLLAVLLIGGLANLILRGIGLSTMGKRKGLDNTWLAFFPYASLYFQGLVAGEVSLFGKKIKNPGLFIILFNIISGVVMTIITYGMVYFSLFKWVMADIHSGANPEELALEAVGSIVIFYILIFIFALVSMFIYGIIALMNYQIYKSFVSTNEAIFHAVLGLFIPLYETICLFVFRDKTYLEEKEKPASFNNMWT